MSLGPPFDQSGLKLQQAVGAAVVLALVGAVAWVLVLSGRTIGRGLTLHVGMATPGLLRVGGKVRLAGREIGEVRGMVAGASGVTGGTRRSVDIETFILKDDAPNVRVNSQIYVGTPSVLGEAYLEVGPPSGGAAPGAPVVDGDHLRGADPPEIDDLLAHSERNLRLVLALLRENRPEMELLLNAGDDLLATLSGLPASSDQLRRIHDQFLAAVDAGSSLLAALRESGGVDRVRWIARDLSNIADETGPELRHLGVRLDAAMARFDDLGTLFAPEKRAQLQHMIASLREAATIGERLAKDVKSLADYVDSGRGSVGAFFADKELFDDLHETHRILKSQPWTFILKPQVEPKPVKKK